MESLNFIKFRRGLVSKNKIIGKALSLGLENTPSSGAEDCCFIKNRWLSFGEVDSDYWNNQNFTEITEEEFMKL
jgi:hypothetical protein